MAKRTISKLPAAVAFVFLFCSSLCAQEQFLAAAYEKAANQASDFFFIHPDEMDENTFDQIRLLKSSTLLKAGYKELKDEELTQEIEFLFDPTLDSALIIAGAEKLDSFTLTDPEGKEVKLTPDSFLTYSFTNQRIVSGRLDKTGLYKITITGEGHSAITVRSNLKAATQNYDFKGIKTEFGIFEAYIRYSQYTSLRRKPIVGEEIQCTLLVKSPSENLKFAFYSRKGKLLENLELKFVSNKRSGTLFRGPCKIPAEPFRYVIYRSADDKNIAQRMIPEIIIPQPAVVEMVE